MSTKVRYLNLFLLLIWVAALAVLSLAPDVKTSPGLIGWDKFNHFAAYAVLPLLLLRTLLVWRSYSGRLLVGAWLAVVTYGLLLEVLQEMMGAGRQFEVGDLLANALGALTACVIFRHTGRRSSTTNDH